MKFIVTSVKDKFNLRQEYKNKLIKYKLSDTIYQEDYFNKSYMEEEYFGVYTIELDTLDKLIELRKEFNKDIIVKDTVYSPEMNYLHGNILVIYDDYID